MTTVAGASTASKDEGARFLLSRALHDLVVPAVVALALVAAMAAAQLLAPAGIRSPATALAGAGAILLAYLRWPRPTLVTFAVFMLVYDSFAIWLNAGVHNVDELAVPGLVVLAALRERPWRKGIFEPLRDGAFALVVLLAVISSVVNGVSMATWAVSLLLVVKAYAFLHVVLWHDWPSAEFRRALTAVFAFAVLALSIGMAEAVVGPAMRDLIGLPHLADVRGELPGISSFMVFVTIFAWFSAFVALYLFAYYLVYRRLWLLVAGLAFGVGAFLAGRRRAIIGLVVGLVGGALAQLRLGVARRTLLRVWLPVGAIALVLLIVFSRGLLDLARQTVVEYGGPEPNLLDPNLPTDPWDLAYYVPGNPRVLLYTTSMTIARDNFPLGAGLGRYASPLSRDPDNFSPLYRQYGLDHIWGLTPHYAAYITDTYWPHILGEIGVFGLIGYGLFIAALGLRLWRATRQLVEPLAHAFALGTLMAFVHALVESSASSMYESSPRIYLTFGAFAVAMALARMSRQRVDATSLDGREPGIA